MIRTPLVSIVEAEVTTRQMPSGEDMLADLGDKLFASVPEAAAVLRSDPRSVRRSIAAGEIPAVPVGPRKLVPVRWLRQAAGLDIPA
jgi:hypothetical protein